MSRLQDVIQQGIRADQPLATDVPVAALYGITDEGDIIERSDGAAWQPYSPTSTGTIVQVVNTQTGAVATGTTTIPSDDTIPQNTEGTEFMTRAITPTSATNKLKIEVVFNGTASASVNIVAALFQDTTADALAAAMLWENDAGGFAQVLFTHYMTAGTTSATTFKVRAGGASASTITFNGSGGARRLGGVMASSITITEIVA